MKNIRRLLDEYYFFVGAVIGSFFLFLGLAPLTWLHILLDPIAPDNHLAFLDLPQLGAIRMGFLVLGCLLALSRIFILLRPHQFLSVCQSLGIYGGSIMKDNTRLLTKLLRVSLNKWEWAILAIIFTVGFLARLFMLSSPMQYDESVTFIDFASRPILAVITDYSLPNNHVFHTLLVHLAYKSFGSAPWVVRLPAFLAGIFIIPSTYFFARFQYDRYVGLLAAALVSWWPQMVYYSANARGYSMIALFSLFIFSMASVVMNEKNSAAWLWISIFSALGLYTIPIMAYPISILYLWIVFICIFGNHNRVYPKTVLIFWICFSGFLTLIFSLLLYLPLIFLNGIKILVSNRFVYTYPWLEFVDRLPFFLGDIWFRLTESMPLYLIIPILIGLVLSLIFQSRVFHNKVSLFAITILFFTIVIPIQRPEMLSKLFFFLIPLLAVWAASGIVFLFRLISSCKAQTVMNYIFALAMVAINLDNSLHHINYFRGHIGEIEQAVNWLKIRMTQNDIVITDFPVDAQIRYYAFRAGLNLSSFRELDDRQYERAYIFVNPVESQTLQIVVNNQPLRAMPIDVNSAVEKTKFGNIQVFIANPKNKVHNELNESDYELKEK